MALERLSQGFGLTELVWLVLAPFGLGAGVLRLLGITFRCDRLGYPGWAWLAGSLGIALLEALRLVLGLSSPAPVLGWAFAATGALYALARWRGRAPLPAGIAIDWKRRANLVFVAFVALALCVTLLRIAYASTSAVVLGDEAIFWSKRAKLLFEAGGLGGSYAQAVATRALDHADYPALNPLLQLFVFDLAGKVTHVANRLPIQLCSVALILCAASALRRVVGPWIAGVLCVLLPACFQAAIAVRLAQSDALVALGALVALDGYLRWRAGGERAWLGLAALAGAFLCWSKHEGVLVFASFVAAAALVTLFTRGLRSFLRPRAEAAALLPALAVLLVTWSHNAWLGAAGSHAGVPGLLERLETQGAENLGIVLTYLARLAIDPLGSALPAAFLVLALCARSAWREPLRVPTLTMLLVYLGLVLIYVSTRDRLQWLLANSAQRVLFQTTPLLALWVGATAREVFGERFGARPDGVAARRPQPAVAREERVAARRSVA